ncbi:MAG: amidohydrolase family protein [Clostridia bacterium]|nr:amidohydrolase family protein [Clostridia bacterium]
MVIDFHTHLFPDKIYEKTIKILENNIWEHSHTHYSAVGTGNLSGLKNDMAKDDIDISLVLPIATHPKQTDNIIAFAYELNGKDGIYSFASLHPDNEDTDGILEKIKEMGFRGIKLHPEYQSLFIDSEKSLKILKKCEDLGLYTVLHTGKDHGCPPPLHCAPDRLRNVLSEISGKYIIAAHMGGWDMWDESMEHIIGTPILIDTCFSLHFMDKEKATDMIKAHGAVKVLFGTDWALYSQKKTLEFLESLSLTSEEKEMIKHKNAEKILGL